METIHLTSAQDNGAGNYRQVGYMRFENEASRITQFGFLALVVGLAAYAFSYLARTLGQLPDTFQVGALEIVIGVVVFIATVVIHVWMQVLVMRRYGVRPEIGLFRHRTIATITVPGYGFHRNTTILIALAPLVALTCLALLGIRLFQGTGWAALFALVAVVNVGASIGDFWLVGTLLRYPSTAWTMDDEDGMRILMPVE